MAERHCMVSDGSLPRQIKYSYKNGGKRRMYCITGSPQSRYWEIGMEEERNYTKGKSQVVPPR